MTSSPREGRLGGTAIVGRTVRRTTGRWTPTVHALLRHLEHVRFEGSPRVLGFDEAGREVLTFLPSEARSRVDAPKSDESLIALGRLLRSFRDAVETFVPPPDADWRLGRTPRPGDVVCHNDVNPGNVVYRNGLPYALIDWDLAGPAPPLDDFLRAVLLFAPLLPDHVCIAWGFSQVPDRARRVRRLCAGYGVDPGAWIVDAVEELERRDLSELVDLGRRGVSPYDTFLATGSEEATRRDLEWLVANRAALSGALAPVGLGREGGDELPLA